MNTPRCKAEDYIDFLIATPKTCSAMEAARVQPQQSGPSPAHDAFTRLLHRLEKSWAKMMSHGNPCWKRQCAGLVRQALADPRRRKTTSVGLAIRPNPPQRAPGPLATPLV
jgi:hypothetical protein